MSVSPSDARLPIGTVRVPGADSDVDPSGRRNQYALYSREELSGDLLTNASMTYERGEPVVAFSFNTKGARKFGRITKENIGKPFAIVLDGEVITAPRINGPILDGNGIITGNFTVESANNLALLCVPGHCRQT